MDVLGNNIANVNTTSYKSQSITFSDLMYQTTQTASGATATKGGVNARQIGLGAKSGAISTAIESQGATQTTNNPFDIMITGDSFFIVNNGKENLYTRDGSFYVDGAGNLAMQSNGYFVQGWVAQEDKETGEIRVNKNGGLSPLQIMSADNSTYSPASTTAALYSGNIDDHDTNVTSDDGKTITLEFYDNKGYLYTGKFTLKDTGTDHLFSLQLTDVLDSDGQSVGNKTLPDGTKLIDHITFGETREKTDKNYVDGYEVIVDSTTGTAKVNQQAGAVAFSKIPTTGTLSDLMTTSSGNGKNVLSKVYGIIDNDVLNIYGKATSYTIDSSGILNFSYDVTDVEKTSGDYDRTNYSYVANNSSSYFADPNTGVAYKVPADSGSVSDLTKDLLVDVFGIDATKASEYVDTSKNYTYTYSDGNLKIYDTLDITEGEIDDLSTDIINKFNGLKNALDGYTGTGELTYKFSNGALTVYETNDVPDAKSAQTEPFSISTDDLNDLSTALDKTFGSGAQEFTYAALNTIAEDDGSNYSANVIAAATTLRDLINAKVNEDDTHTTTDFSDVTAKVLDITGTKGVAVSYMGTKKGDPVAWTPSYQQNTEEDEDASYDTSVISNIFRAYDFDNTKIIPYGKAYYLPQNPTTLDNIPAGLLEEAYSTNSEVLAFLSSADDSTTYTVNVANNGAISITHVEQANGGDGYGISTEYNMVYDSVNGVIDYTTANDMTLWTPPTTGNISSLLEVASGDNKGLLKATYGIDDDDARAFGDDGIYTINPDGSITLTAGSHTVQLKFDAANGSLISANDNSGGELGKVKMIFEHVDGLEAFGYQMTGNDPEDVVEGQVVFDFSTVTNYNTSGSSTIKAVKGDKKSLNTGRAVGEMNGVNISTDGQIYATYSNGQTKLLGQIASAQFANASGLSKEGDNLYSSTLNSGEATVQDITTDGGYMNTGVLEMSNVDLSREFTEMITTQRGFQANSRIITVSDTLLEELTNLKR
jgi:flagellar hook protein FlgE